MKINSLVLPAAFLAASAALAGEQSLDQMYTALDTDYDGRISVAEAAADKAVLERFKDADKDGDGYLSRNEFAALAGKQQ